MNNLQEIFIALKSLLQKYQPPFAPKTDNRSYYDLWSFKDLVIEGRTRKDVFFAGLIIQKAYVGFYFMPVYAEPEMKKVFSPGLLKLLKGKSCFHVKSLSPELLVDIESALRAGFVLYQERSWI